MFKKALLSVCIFTGIALAGTTTVVLQNGRNGYNGCIDSYLEYGLTTPQGNLNHLYFSCG